MVADHQSVEHQGGVRPPAMRSIAIGAAVAATAALVALPAPAQQTQAVIWCVNKGNVYSAEVAINGCTVTIEAGQEPPKTLALAYNNRGLAYADKGDLDHAVADYGEAIELDPGLAL